MTTPDTLLFLGLLALALWRSDRRFLLMAGVVGVCTGLTAVSLAPSPWTGLAVAAIGIYLIVRVIRAVRSERKTSAQRSVADQSHDGSAEPAVVVDGVSE